MAHAASEKQHQHNPDRTITTDVHRNYRAIIRFRHNVLIGRVAHTQGCAGHRKVARYSFATKK
ncbi:MAG: hypothetical protein AAF497_15235, partial [Planctomycetota bacterium]